jgi:hypothetical protein
MLLIPLLLLFIITLFYVATKEGLEDKKCSNDKVNIKGDLGVGGRLKVKKQQVLNSGQKVNGLSKYNGRVHINPTEKDKAGMADLALGDGKTGFNKGTNSVMFSANSLDIGGFDESGLYTNNNNVVETGKGLTKQVDAGKIGYKKFSDGLDIVGAGEEGTPHKVKLWDNVEVNTDLQVNGNIKKGGSDVPSYYHEKGWGHFFNNDKPDSVFFGERGEHYVKKDNAWDYKGNIANAPEYSYSKGWGHFFNAGKPNSVFLGEEGEYYTKKEGSDWVLKGNIKNAPEYRHDKGWGHFFNDNKPDSVFFGEEGEYYVKKNGNWVLKGNIGKAPEYNYIKGWGHYFNDNKPNSVFLGQEGEYYTKKDGTWSLKGNIAQAPNYRHDKGWGHFFNDNKPDSVFFGERGEHYIKKDGNWDYKGNLNIKDEVKTKSVKVDNVIELAPERYGQGKKEINAGKIAYKAFGNQLDIVGATTADSTAWNNDRNVKVWDNLEIQNNLQVKGSVTTVNDLNVTGKITIGTGTNKWVITPREVGNANNPWAWLEILHKDINSQHNWNENAGHIIISQDGNIWLPRAGSGRGWVVDNISNSINTRR